MSYLISTLYFIAVLSVLIVVHEWGHFIVAKLCGMRVEDFSLFFGKRLVRLGVRNGTEYNIRAVPLGGFVKIAGMEPDDGAEPADVNGYNQKPVWKRAAVIFAGPFMSVMFGCLVFCVMGFTTGLPAIDRVDTMIEAIVTGMPAAQAGLLPGDRIVGIDGRPVTDGAAMVKSIHKAVGRTLTIAVMRDGKQLSFRVTPAAEPAEQGEGVGGKMGMIGIRPKIDTMWQRLPPALAIKNSGLTTYFMIKGTYDSLFSRNVTKNVGGIISIGVQIHHDSSEGPRMVAVTAAELSISVGLINLLPIPILDGGHLMLLGIELLRRRKPTTREVYVWQMLGISLIGVLFVLVMFNDILRIRRGS